MQDFVLILQELQGHPKSYLAKLVNRFETPSVVRITRKDELRSYAGTPLFNEKYLVLFDDLRVFKDNLSLLNLKTMIVVIVLEFNAQVEDAKFLLEEKKISFKIFRNEFTKHHALELITMTATSKISESTANTLLKQVGLHPIRIIAAVDICEQVGYTKAAIEKYVDKWVYSDWKKLISWLLGDGISKADRSRVLASLHSSRSYFKYVRASLLDILEYILCVYRDILSGESPSDDMYRYLEQKHMSRSQVLYALNLFERVSISSVFQLREFLRTCSFLELVTLLN